MTEFKRTRTGVVHVSELTQPRTTLNRACVKWRPEMVEQAYKLSLLGLQDKHIALFFGVSLRTLDDWKIYRPEFVAALRRGQMEANMKVAESLFRRINGYRYREVTRYKNARGEVFREEETIKTAHPDTAAGFKWLSIRQPETWSETQRKELSVSYQGRMDVAMLSQQLADTRQYTTEELEMALKLSIGQIIDQEAKEMLDEQDRTQDTGADTETETDNG